MLWCYPFVCNIITSFSLFVSKLFVILCSYLCPSHSRCSMFDVLWCLWYPLSYQVPSHDAVLPGSSCSVYSMLLWEWLAGSVSVHFHSCFASGAVYWLNKLCCCSDLQAATISVIQMNWGLVERNSIAFNSSW